MGSVIALALYHPWKAFIEVQTSKLSKVALSVYRYDHCYPRDPRWNSERYNIHAWNNGNSFFNVLGWHVLSLYLTVPCVVRPEVHCWSTYEVHLETRKDSEGSSGLVYDYHFPRVSLHKDISVVLFFSCAFLFQPSFLYLSLPLLFTRMKQESIRVGVQVSRKLQKTNYEKNWKRV